MVRREDRPHKPCVGNLDARFERRWGRSERVSGAGGPHPPMRSLMLAAMALLGACASSRLPAPVALEVPHSYATFFKRVKQEVARRWQPTAAMPLDPSFGSSENRRTVLMVTLDAEGRIDDLSVVQSSGSPSFDREASEAFERAQPFANPPPRLLDARRRVRFTFAFPTYGL